MVTVEDKHKQTSKNDVTKINAQGTQKNKIFGNLFISASVDEENRQAPISNYSKINNSILTKSNIPQKI